MKVPATRDLYALGESARQRNLPILLAVVQEHCTFCHKVREEILEPMLLSGEYRDKILMRQLYIDHDEPLPDFTGRRRPGGRIASDDYRVWVTPTLLFLNPEGRELSARILGVNTIELYAHYVDAGIDQALARQRGVDRSVYLPSREDIGIDAGGR